MLEFLLALAAPLQDGQLQDEQLEPSVVNVEHQRLSLGQINNLYRNGRPSNDVHLAGLFVHQHDDAQGAAALVFDTPTDEENDWFATSIVHKGLPGMYNGECGAIIDPSAVEVQCSYYADMTTSNPTGCDSAYLPTSGWHDPGAFSRVREAPFPPDQLMDMMKMSQELQSNQTALMNYRTARTDGTGETDGDEFWLGQYNEVLLDKAQYVSKLPFSIAALFHVEGGNAESCSCILQARAAMLARYGSDAEHVLLLKHTPGANTAFVSSECTPE